MLQTRCAIARSDMIRCALCSDAPCDKACKKLKTGIFKTTKLTSKKVGKNAFKNVYKKVTFKIPKKKLNAYQKWLKLRGAPKNSRYKKTK